LVRASLFLYPVLGIARSLVLLALAATAAAHGGGSFRDPSGGIPPGLRLPPPEPPAPAVAERATGIPRMPLALPIWWEWRATELLDLKRHLYAPKIDAHTPLWGARQFRHRPGA
jgi:hypothetical protein